MKLLRDVFTERDGHTFDLKRLIWALGVLWFMGLESYAVAVKGLVFDPIATGTALAGLIAAGGAALAMNRNTESNGKGDE